MPAAARLTASEIVDALAAAPLTGVQRAYVSYHARRYAFLVDLVREHVERTGGRRVLDVGPGFQTRLLRQALEGVAVDTLGYRADDLAQPQPGERHVQYDLTRAGDRDTWPTFEERYDVVVLAEVIEHLQTSPLAIYELLAARLRPGGALVVQTPNGASLANRVRLLRGRSPYGAGSVVAPAHNPGHFREYLPGELRELADAVGLQTPVMLVTNHFERTTALARAYDRLTSVLPSSWREGITAVHVAPASGR